MLMQMQMHCGVVVRFVICLCLAGFIAAKCVPEMCGDLKVSYPFWINNSDCGYPGFQITCREGKDTGMLSPYLIASLGNYADAYYFKIMEIDYMGHLIINSYIIYAYSCDPSTEERNYFELPLDGPFTLSNSNKLVAIGCGSVGTYTYDDLGEAKCTSMCDLNNNQPYCPFGCCEINLPDNWQWINFTATVILFSNDTNSSVCGFSTIMEPSTFTIADNNTNLLWGEGWNVSYGVRLNWGIGLQNCSMARGTANYSCSINAECLDSPSGQGHVCKCLPGYEGNGYSNGTDCTDRDECRHKGLNRCVGEEGGGICHNLPGSYKCSCVKGYAGDGFRNGTYCTDINECRNKWSNRCVGAKQGGICYNMPGFYNCSCAKGFVGDGFTNGTDCEATSSNSLVFPAIIGSVSSFVVVSLAASLFVWWLKKRHLKLVEAKYYHQLQQHIASRVGRETLRIFSAKELAKASNNYSKEMVLGSGGFGTVFKGVLPDDTVVAIKKSNQAINLEDDHEFLNEVTILSQINHRNIVKLLGCCIQTKFPLLVSEFVPNGTLFEHLHSKEEVFPWASRVQIAIETGEALAYLHSGASQPIFHRDVKSSNILLNERFSPRVADFGISRLISASNNTHVTTNNIVGTRGYLDPQYFQTYQLTEKSDVYSFGVVLVELLTALKPICIERASHEWSLSSLFLSRLNSNCLREILDRKILDKEIVQQIEDIARIARECLHFERRKRPSMKEVVEELICVRDNIRKTKFHENVKCEDVIFEETSISREASQTSYEFRSYTFPSAFENTTEKQSTVLIQMSNLVE